MNEFGDDVPPALVLGGDIRQLLGKLSRKGAFVKFDRHSRIEEPTCEVYLARDGGYKSLVSLPRQVAEIAKRDGLLKLCGKGDEWKLSAKGARALRAVRCANVDSARSDSASSDSVSSDSASSRPRNDRAAPRASRSPAARPPQQCQPKAKTPKPNINDAESPLGWLRRRKSKNGTPMLGQAQFDAGERLRADFWLGQMTPRVTANWSPTAAGRSSGARGAGGNTSISDNALAARERVRQALDAVGPELAGVLIDVCCHLKGLEMAERNAGWPQRSGKVVLVLSLDALARHYGFAQAQAGCAKSGSAIGHWGTDGYRPLFETDET